MKITPTPLPDVLLLTPDTHDDARGFFRESWNGKKMADLGLNIAFVQDNQSFSHRAGTLRGLHFQTPPHAQDKLVRCGRGVLWDVAVDIRAGSPAFGQWFGTELSFDNGRQLLIPAGFLHGFMALSDDCEILYKCSAHHAPDHDRCVAWNDPDIAITWPDAGPVILSDRDRHALRLRDLGTPFAWADAA